MQRIIEILAEIAKIAHKECLRIAFEDVNSPNSPIPTLEKVKNALNRLHS